MDPPWAWPSCSNWILPGLDHPVDEAGEELWLVAGELAVGQHQTLQPDWELDVTASNLDAAIMKATAYL